LTTLRNVTSLFLHFFGGEVLWCQYVLGGKVPALSKKIRGDIELSYGAILRSK
jgi:hypothetical protein